MHDTARCLGYPSDSSGTEAGSGRSSRAPNFKPQARSISESLCSFADALRRHLRHRCGPLVRPAVQSASASQAQAGPSGGFTPPSPALPLVWPAVPPASGQSGLGVSGHLLRHRPCPLVRPAVLHSSHLPGRHPAQHHDLMTVVTVCQQQQRCAGHFMRVAAHCTPRQHTVSPTKKLHSTTPVCPNWDGNYGSRALHHEHTKG